jgi:hypothetical protein
MKGGRVCKALYTLHYERAGKMKVIERKMLTAIKAGKCTNLGNTTIDVWDNVTTVRLFNNEIARFDFATGELEITTRYQSATTKSRLNAILREFANTSIHQTNYVWFYSDKTYTNGARTFYGVSK